MDSQQQGRSTVGSFRGYLDGGRDPVVLLWRHRNPESRICMAGYEF